MKTKVHLLGRKIPLWAVGAGLILFGLLAYAPYFGSGFSADDFIFINMLEGATPYNPWLGFWGIPVENYQGFTQLWWMSAEGGGAFLRPIASWTLTALYRVFGRNALPFHVTSALIHSLGAFAAFLVLRRLSQHDAPALLAAFLFLICEDHGMTVAWIATITDLLCALFLNLAFWFHITAREERRPWRFGLSLLFFLAALGSKETAAIYPVIIIVYEFFFAEHLAAKHLAAERLSAHQFGELSLPSEHEKALPSERGRMVPRERGGKSISNARAGSTDPAGFGKFGDLAIPSERGEPAPSERGRGVTLRERIRFFLRGWWAWAIPLVVFAIYMAFYRSLFPPVGGLMYVDPFSQPLRYLVRTLPNLPVMFVALLTQYLPSLVMMMPGSLPFVAALGVVLLVLLIWALLFCRNERSVWFALLTFTLSLLPGLATDPGERLLYFPSVYGLFIVAWLILQIPRLRSALSPPPVPLLSSNFGNEEGVPSGRDEGQPWLAKKRQIPPKASSLTRAWGWYLLVSALILPILLLFIYPFMWIPSMGWPEDTVTESLPLIEADTHQHVVYLNTNSSYNTFYLPDIYRYHRGEYVDLRVLSSFNGHVSARSEGEHTILLRTEDTGWLSNMFARLVRTEPKYSVGDEYITELFTATILKTTPDREDVLEVRFTFNIPLNDPSLVLLYYDGENHQRWVPTQEWQLLNTSLEPFSF
ncbi:MAG: hypothetical protein MAG431_00790 [Chloroflexi bacterium]|nr:hypothetical protein [Chloroflexota bacterium]